MGTSQGPLFAPGARPPYSNTNYTVAGLIIEKVTGQTLAQQFDQRIFEPLKLEHSLPDGADITGQHAHGYFVLGDPAPPPTSPASARRSAGPAAASCPPRRRHHVLPGAVRRQLCGPTCWTR